MFKIDCPRCKAPTEEANLEVVSGTFDSRMPLTADGFTPLDSKQFDTDNEMVACDACGDTFPLGECLDDEVNEDSGGAATLTTAAPDAHALLTEIVAILCSGADFQLGPKGRHAALLAQLDAYFAQVLVTP